MMEATSSHTICEQRPSLRLTTSGTSIREIRESMQRSPVVSSKAHATPTKPKRRSMFLGGLFQKEPSKVALEQFAANIQAQRETTKTKTVAFVSSQKMPQHVPKVNSKWDGVPEAIKESEKARAQNKRLSLLPSSANGFRIGRVDGPLHRRNSLAGSWDSRSSGSRPEFQDNPRHRPESMYSSSSGDSCLGRQFSKSISPSGKIDLREKSIPTTANVSMMFQPASNAGQETTRNQTSPVLQELMSECTSSPSLTPLDRSPRTPVSCDGILHIQSSTTVPPNAFLAGEARPLTLTKTSPTTVSNSDSFYRSQWTGKVDRRDFSR